LRVGSLVAKALLGKVVDVWGDRWLVSVATKAISAQGVDDEQKDVGFTDLGIFEAAKREERVLTRAPLARGLLDTVFA